MLRKLMKHELRATSRIMLPLLGVVLVFSLFLSLALRGEGLWATNDFFNLIFALIGIAYGISLGAVFIVAMVLMINRFRTNLLGDEGYVMFTLPVSTHQLLWSKIIISSLWFFSTTLMVFISALIVSADVSIFEALKSIFREIWEYMSVSYALNGTALVIECLVLFFVTYAVACLQFYAAMSIGYSFHRRKLLYSILVFFGMQFIMQFLLGIYMISDIGESFFNGIMFNIPDGMMGMHIFFGGSILFTVILGGIFYVITTSFLKKRLNIE